MAKKPRPDQLAPREDTDEVNRDVQYWLDEIAASRERDDDFIKDGQRVRAIYAGEKKDETPFNILFSNTEVIAPALYSQVPRPVVRRRYKDNDPVGFAAAKAGQRILEFLLDTNIEGYDTANESLKAVTLDALLPGRGVSTLKYDAEVNDVYSGRRDADGKKITSPVKKSELVCPEIRSWDRVFYGYATKWSKVPWVAFEEHIDRAEAKRLFDPAIVKQLKFSKGEKSDNEGRQSGGRTAEDKINTGARKTCLIYQIWDKAGGRKIRYISPSYKDGYLSVDDDELNITGFFSCPRPVQFIDKTDDMTPTSPYVLYENQAQELNSLTIRISKIVKACKARGGYDGELGDDLKNIMDGDDNELIPLDKASSLATEKGLDNAIWFMPLDKLIQTLKELVNAREMCKQVIYEIMGISDIIRGASKASETLGAQQIKSQWGTLRIKPKQAEIQRYACDMLRIMLEIAAQKFSEETWAKMTGLDYLTTQQIEEGKRMLMAAQKQAAGAQQALTRLAPPTPPAPPGAPPQDPNAPPDPNAPNPQAQAMAAAAQAQAAKAVMAQTPAQQMAIQRNQQALNAAQQTIAQIQQEAQKPKWPEVLASLKDDIQRSYKIDIETNSTIEPEAAEDQKNIADMMAALGQFLQSVGPLVQEGMMPFQVAQSMLLAITRRFRFGDEIEEMIQQMQPPQPQDKSKEALDAANQQIQQLQGQLQAKEMEARGKELDGKQKDMENAAAQTDLKTQIDKAGQDHNTLMAQKDLDKREMQLKSEQRALEQERKIFKLEQDRAVEKVTGNAKSADTALKQKKENVDTMAKQADQRHKDAETAAKQVDDKAAKLIEQLNETISKMQEIDKSFGEKVTMAKVLQTVGGPRKTKINRGADGRASELVSEPA